MSPSIAIINYGMGNRRSVEKAFNKVGANATITADPETIRDADGAVVVGVGAFPEAMGRLEASGMADILRERREQGRPILGICLGLQIFFEGSDEHGQAKGLGFLDGWVRKLQANGLKLPQIGWNEVEWSQGSRLCEGIAREESTFYHLHSFAAYDAEAPDAFFARPDVVGKATYTCTFATAIEKPPVYGVQFHPEKSSQQGLKLLKNFTDICVKAKQAA
jgi:imidazole glycerol-phosphate synthase subunit HisH